MDSQRLADILGSPAEWPCETCKSLVPDRKKTDEATYIHTIYQREDVYPDYPGLAASAVNGCKLCNLFRHVLISVGSLAAWRNDENDTHPFWNHDTGQDLSLTMNWDRRISITATLHLAPFKPLHESDRFSLEGQPPQYNGMVHSLWLKYGPVARPLRSETSAEFWSGSVLEMSVFDSPDLEADDESFRRRLPSLETLCQGTTKMMKGWIDDCTNNHSSCNSPMEPWVPTRLLEVTANGNSFKMRLVGITSSAFNPGSRFAALSHMWGDISTSPPLQTFQSNLEKLQKNIEPTDLPRNFADAARVCIQLEIQYLWIDSLCIIQDSAEDWKREAVKMHLVYRHAVVTIVATSATSTHDGFLNRDFEKTLAAKINYSLEYDQEDSPSRHSRDRYMVFYRREHYEDSFPTYAINNAKWNTRAWTMQERSLSTRLIHFCRNKIFFECRSCIKSEENEPAAHYALMSRILWPRDPSTSMDTLYEYWQWCLTQYCPRNLTKGKDKLIAIQSVAEEMMSTTKWEYVRFAGTWRHNIKEELFWIFPYGEARRPDASRAPTWSWSALDGHISFNPRVLPMGKRNLPEPLARIFEEIEMKVIDVYPSREDTPSDDVHGYLEVKAWVRPIATVKAKHVNDDEEFFPFKIVAGADGASHGSGEHEHVFAHGRLDVDTPRGNTRLLYLHIGIDKRPTGLILELGPEGTTRKGESLEVWRRVGVASVFDDERGFILSENLFEDGTGRSKIIMV